MKFIQRKEFIFRKEHEYILIPYFEEADLEKQLHQIITGESIIENIIKEQRKTELKTVFIPVNKDCVSITFLKLGNKDDFELSSLIEQFQNFGRQSKEDYQILLEGLTFKQYTIEQVTEVIIRAMLHGGYAFNKNNLTKLSENRIFEMRDQLIAYMNTATYTLINSTDLQSNIEKAINYGECINYARMLGDVPNNYLHVKQLAEYAADLSLFWKLPCEVLGKKELEELHSGGILGVNAGSKDEAKLIAIYYEGSKDAPVTALIGKGVMFDSGGYHLKSAGGMKDMKYDMCGAANILAVLEIAVRQRSRKNILAVIPAVENLIGPSACKAGDVLTTMSGKTVEVYNTDAEGRLILCDVITYAIKKGADALIDQATLTESCQRALGNEISGVFSNNDEFCNEFTEKAKEQCEKVWRLPLDPVFHKPLHNTQTADLINYAPGSGGGASVAACFLEEFVEKGIPWLHIDIVGTSVKQTEDSRQSAGATGVLTASLAALLE